MPRPGGRGRVVLAGLWVAASVSLLVAAPAQAKPVRVALVVGVAHYQSVNPLKNTLNDAQLVGDTLRKLGFTVTTIADPQRADLMSAIETFRAQAQGLSLIHISEPTRPY